MREFHLMGKRHTALKPKVAQAWCRMREFHLTGKKRHTALKPKAAQA
jgi:hypothetical protein